MHFVFFDDYLRYVSDFDVHVLISLHWGVQIKICDVQHDTFSSPVDITLFSIVLTRVMSAVGVPTSSE
jgi:hypothetical protein